MSRDEKLKANQRKLAEKRRAKRLAEAKAKKAKEAPKKTKSSNATKVAFDKKNDFGSSLKVKTSAKTTPQRKPPTAPPPVTQEKKKDPPKQTTPTKYRQQATVTRDNRNRGTETGGIRNTGGRGLTPQAQPNKGPKPKRSDFPSTRMGTLAYQGALRKWENKNDKPSSGSSAGRRTGRRGQGSKK